MEDSNSLLRDKGQKMSNISGYFDTAQKYLEKSRIK